MATGKEIRFGVEGRAAMLKGVDLLADAVQVSSSCLECSRVSYCVYFAIMMHIETQMKIWS